MRISIVIPTCDREVELAALLSALEKQTRRPEEVVIVDSSSPPVPRP